MRYLILIGHDEADNWKRAQAEPSGEPDSTCNEPIYEAYGKYTDELKKAGVLLGGEALQPTARGARITVAGGKRKVVDGPFAESKEVVGGFFIIQVKSREEALEWAARCPAARLGASNYVELRAVEEIPQ